MMEDNETPSVPPPTPVVSSAPIPDIESQVAIIRARRRKGFNWLWVVAPLMLLIGMVIGYFGRPLLSPQSASSGKPDVIDMLVSQTRHFKGNANAPVTMLEFSDFQ